MFQQLRPIIYSANRQTTVGLRAMAGEKIKLEEEAIREILVADPAWESGAEVASLKTSLRKKKNRSNNNNNKPQQKSPKQTLASEPDCTAVCALFAATERAHSAPEVTQACASCLVSQNFTQK